MLEGGNETSSLDVTTVLFIVKKYMLGYDI